MAVSPEEDPASASRGFDPPHWKLVAMGRRQPPRSVSTPNTSETKCVSFPHQAILQVSVDTSWVSYNLIQF